MDRKGEELFSGHRVSVLYGKKVLELLYNNVNVCNTTELYI
jgi:hypothetical protein